MLRGGEVRILKFASSQLKDYPFPCLRKQMILIQQSPNERTPNNFNRAGKAVIPFENLGGVLKGWGKMRPLSEIGIFLFSFLYLGCGTERYVAPAINTSSRIGLNLKTPVLAAVYDGRTSGDKPEAASDLQKELSRIYGSNLQWSPYFGAVPQGHVAIRIRIIMFGSTFGSRLISSVAYANAVQNAQSSITGPWGTVVGNASGTSSVFASSFSGEGWWNGAAWLDVEIQDNRNSPGSRFTIPIAAEHKESNMWGYSSGDKAARKAWTNVSAQLTRTLDEVLRVLRDSEG